MKVGVLGGTFDPVHLGHLMMAEEAREALGLSEVIMVPAGQPPFKRSVVIASAEHRLRMLELAVADRPHIRLSTMELEHSGPSYTVDTIAGLRAKYGRESEIYFILGWDSLEQLAEWREPARIISMCFLAAVPRPGYLRPDLRAFENSIPGISQRVVIMDKPNIDISSSSIRELVERGEPVDRLVPGPVADYIKKHKLYLTK